MSALLPCPFCGGEATTIRWTSVSTNALTGVEIQCDDCGANGEKHRCGNDSEQSAIAAWNRRHVPEGFVLVPVEPTEAMTSAIWTTYTNSQVPPEDLRGITWEELARWAKERPRLQEIVDLCWAEARAMLAAAKETKE